MCSRATGFLRDVALSFAFGAGAELAAFLVAFRFWNLFRRLLGESALSGSFIPFFEEMRKESPEKGALFLRDLGFSLLVLLLGFLVLGEGAFERFAAASRGGSGDRASDDADASGDRFCLSLRSFRQLFAV